MPQFSEMQLALMVVVVLLAIMAPRMIMRSRKSRSRSDLAELRRRLDAAEQGSAAQRSANQALTELLEASRDINAQIDTKIRVLNKLVKDADNEARRLERLLGVSAGAPEVGAAVDGLPAGYDDRAPVAISHATGVEAGDVLPGKPTSSQSARRCRDLCARVSRMQSEGRSSTEIAQITGLSVQEVSMLSQIGVVQAATREQDSGNADV